MDFSGMFQTWINVLTKPGEATFEAERHGPNATLSAAIIWIVIAGFISAIFGVISMAISSLMGGGVSMMEKIAQSSDLPPEAAQFFAMSAGGGIAVIGMIFCLTLIFVPVGFLIGSGIYFLIAKLFKGTGSFEEQTYLLATFTAPIMVINAAISIIPFLGGCVGFIIAIYQLVLTYFALKVSHNLTSGKAIGVILTPILIGLLCAGCAFAATLITILSAASQAQ
jgi:hypothetical protein